MRSLLTSAALPLLCAAACCAVLAAPAVSAPPAGAAGSVPDTFNLRITAELRALSPAAESLWAEANHCREVGDRFKAVDLYGRVISLAPDFYHAKRRLAMELLADGQGPAALDLMREAYAAAETPENMSALAEAIIRSGEPITESEAQEALALATGAVGLRPDDLDMLYTLCDVALAADDPGRLRAAAEHVARVAPDSVASHVFLAVSRSIDERHDEAAAELERAHALGLPDADYEYYKSALAEARSQFTPGGLLRIGEWVLGTWIAALLLLLGAGLFLRRQDCRGAACTRRTGAARGGAMMRTGSSGWRSVTRPMIGVHSQAEDAHMQVGRESCRATAIVLVLIAGVTIGHCTPVAAEEGPAVDSAAALEDAIRALRMEARYDAALVLARDLLAKRRADPEAKPYEVGDAERLVATLERVVGLAQEEQQRLAEADFMTIEIEKLCSEMNFLEASEAAQEQLTVRREVLGAEHPDVATSLDHLACVLHEGHGAGQDIRYGDLNPESMLREALAIRRTLLEPQHPDIAASADHVASLLADRGNYSEETEELYREALAIRRQTSIPPSDLIESIDDLLILLVEQGGPDADREIEVLARESTKLVRSGALIRCHSYLEPERISMPERVYPPDAVRGRREGTVYVAALVGKDGEVKYAAVTKGVHESLNRDAVDTIKRCRFKPGRCDGRAVAIWGLDIPMEYKIH